jgi:ElaB/YqjD/DUF883 family membrane-anchored ribosome-binding protein
MSRCVLHSALQPRTLKIMRYQTIVASVKRLAVVSRYHTLSSFAAAQQSHRRLACTFISTASPPLKTLTNHQTMSPNMFQAIFPCFTCTDHEEVSFPSEKVALLLVDREDAHKAALIADDVVDTLMRTNISGAALQMQLDSIVGTYGWTEKVANWILEKLSRLLEEGHEKLGPTIRDAYQKAFEAATRIEGFVIEHPVFCTVVALGVLVLISPWVLEALGFAELGPVAGT